MDDEIKFQESSETNSEPTKVRCRNLPIVYA